MNRGMIVGGVVSIYRTTVNLSCHHVIDGIPHLRSIVDLIPLLYSPPRI